MWSVSIVFGMAIIDSLFYVETRGWSSVLRIYHVYMLVPFFFIYVYLD